MTAPKSTRTSIWAIDRKTALWMQSFEKQPQTGVSGTNRKFSRNTVTHYAVDMLTDQWQFSHQGIAFIGYLDDGTAELVDGGQRLRALVLATGDEPIVLNGVEYQTKPGFSFEIMVTEGLTRQSAEVMDIGRRRSAADFLQRDGEVSTLTLGSAISLCNSYENVPFSLKNWADAKMTPHQRRAYLQDNPRLREGIREGSRIWRHVLTSAAASGWYLAIKAGIPEDRIREFMDAVVSGEFMARDNPAMRLRETMANAKAKKRYVSREEQLALFIKSFNAWDKGRTIGLLQFKPNRTADGNSGEAFPRFQA